MDRRGNPDRNMKSSSFDPGDLVILSISHRVCTLYRGAEHVRVEALMHLPLPPYETQTGRMWQRETGVVIRTRSLELGDEYYGTPYTNDGAILSIEAAEVLVGTSAYGWIGAHYLQKVT